MTRLAQLWVSLVLTAYDASIGVTEGFGLWSRRVSGRYHDNPERDPMTNGVNIEKRGAIMVVTLDRPKANAIDAQTSRDLGAAFVEFRDDDSLLCAIITGGGDRIFSAGWDLKAAAAGEDESADFGPGGFAGVTELWDLYKPVIAAVNGVAVGGGVELALACDIIVAVEGATFSLPETGVGVAADAGGLQRLPRKIPYNIAVEMLLTGRRMDMTEAKSYGLVNHVVPRDELMPKALELAASIVRGAPLSIKAIKEILRGIDGVNTREAFHRINQREFPIHRQMLTSEDHDEGPRAFAEKREPIWKGR